MKTLLFRFSFVATLAALTASCSLFESENEGAWTGTWIYQSDAASLDASLHQRGSDLFGTIEQVFTRDGASLKTKFYLKATVEDGTATGSLHNDDDETPMKIIRQGETIRLEVMTWSWMPVLTRKDL